MRAHLYENDIGAGLSQANGNGLTDASRAASDESGLALEGKEGGGHDDVLGPVWLPSECCAGAVGDCATYTGEEMAKCQEMCDLSQG
jgi:hypothetical protein